jgi:hypothetical protein
MVASTTVLAVSLVAATAEHAELSLGHDCDAELGG